MFFILPIFIIFLITLSVYLRKGSRKQEDITRQFWEKERQANFTRKKDLTTLEYICLSPELLPGNLHTEAEQALLAMTDQKMLNLTQYTNTDLKTMYGPSNLDALSDFESAYVRMIAQLIIYAGELIEAGQKADAQKLLEFAVSCQEDSIRVYELLAEIYQDNGDDSSLQKLLKSAQELTTINRKTILAKLEEYSIPV